jgi:hypothetical protein
MAARLPERIGLLPLSVLVLGLVAAIAWAAVLMYGFFSLMSWLL